MKYSAGKVISFLDQAPQLLRDSVYTECVYAYNSLLSAAVGLKTFANLAELQTILISVIDSSCTVKTLNEESLFIKPL